jgi:hypothetical protein
MGDLLLDLHKLSSAVVIEVGLLVLDFDGVPQSHLAGALGLGSVYGFHLVDLIHQAVCQNDGAWAHSAVNVAGHKNLHIYLFDEDAMILSL